MNITRIERDGVEFFTLHSTGDSGMSESGLARLCGVKKQSLNELLQSVMSGNSSVKCLKALFGKDLKCQISLPNRGLGVVSFIRAEVCAAVIEYYAFESRRKTPEALFAYRKFAASGITAWIHTITGWQNLPSVSPRSPLSTRQSTLVPAPADQSATIDFEMIDYLLDRRLPSTVHRLYLYLLKADVLGTRPNVHVICKEAKISRPSFYRSVRILQNLNLTPAWLVVETYHCIERVIRDRLKHQLGGRCEVSTPFGPIDVLTPAELIEIKAIENWKEAIGHVLTKAQFYPNHAKRIHLFGAATPTLEDIQTCCGEFCITVTFEVMDKIVNNPAANIAA